MHDETFMRKGIWAMIVGVLKQMKMIHCGELSRLEQLRLSSRPWKTYPLSRDTLGKFLELPPFLTSYEASMRLFFVETKLQPLNGEQLTSEAVRKAPGRLIMKSPSNSLQHVSFSDDCRKYCKGGRLGERSMVNAVSDVRLLSKGTWAMVKKYICCQAV